MTRRPSNPAALVLLAMAGGAALLKWSKTMSRLSDVIKNLSDVAAAAVANDAALRQENEQLRSQLADAQANAASPEELAQLEAVEAELAGLTQAQPPQP